MADVQTVLRGADIELAEPSVPSVEDVEAYLPDEIERYEVVDGQAILTVEPLEAHQLVITELGYEFVTWTRTLGGAVRYSSGVRVARTRKRQPDILVLTAEHLDRFGERTIWAAPDLVVEVLSPTTRKVDLGAKKEEYAALGVREYWCIDALAGMALVAVPPEAEWRVVRRGEPLTSVALEGFSVELDAILPPVKA